MSTEHLGGSQARGQTRTTRPHRRAPVTVKKREYIAILICLVCVGAIYFSTLAVNHCEAEDSLRYLGTIASESFSKQFHPHHLLYHVVNYMLYHGGNAWGLTGSVEITAQSLNVVFGLLGLAALFLMVTRLGLPLFSCVSAVLLLAFSYGYWWYSVECEVYIMPIPFVLLTFYMLLTLQTAFARWQNHAFLALFFSLAVLFHQQHALLGLTILAAYGWIARTRADEIPARLVWSRFALFGLLSALLVAIPYLYAIVGVNRITTLSGMHAWVFDYAITGSNGKWSVGALAKGIVFAPRVVIGSHFLFSSESIQNALTAILPDNELREEFFLVSGLSAGKAVGLFSIVAAIVAGSLSILAEAVRRRVTILSYLRSEHSPYLYICFTGGVFIASYSLFNIWWEPQNVEFWIALCPIVIAILAVILVPLIEKWWIRLTLCGLVGGLFFVNLQGSVLLQTSHDQDYWYVFNRYLIEEMNADDMVISGVSVKGVSYISDGYIDFYCPASAFLIGKYRLEHRNLTQKADLERALHLKVEQCSPTRVFFTMPREQRLTDPDAAEFLAPYLSNAVRVHQDDYLSVYRFTGDFP